VEHAHPLDRPFPWRAATLAGALLVLVALAAAGALALTHGREGTRPEPGSGQVLKRPPAPPLRPRTRISVLVLNGNGVAHAAGAAATRLLANGYRHAVPADAPSLDYARSVVLYRPGWAREAERLARDARIGAVAPLDGRVAPPYAHLPLVLILGSN
jgi:LytR cell envelope-related transcriptional attenuator